MYMTCCPNITLIYPNELIFKQSEKPNNIKMVKHIKNHNARFELFICILKAINVIVYTKTTIAGTR